MAAVSSRDDIDIRWELSQILPYRRANRELEAGISAAIAQKRRFAPLTAADGLREIIKELI
jgi:hypothetical protein